MPPWLPEPGHGEFQNSRRLADSEVKLFARWLADATPEGAREDLPPAPKFMDGWRLGVPDLIVRLPQWFELSGEGPDIYRNFVLPVPISSNRFVRAIEFRPDSPTVHHARFLLDQTGQTRQRDAQDAEVGFGGMNVPARFPAGHLLTWAPGRQPFKGSESLSWLLEKNTDVVLQMHLQQTGKKERVQPTLAFYFIDQAPGRTPFVLGLVAQIIDIPAGAANYTVRRSFVLPGDVDLLAVMPHAHYLGKEVEFTATGPDGPTQSLLLIKRWDFNWQDEYRYSRPVFLSRGTRLHFRISFDNSTNNVRNPNHPPKRVVFGPQSTDEMGELWLQVLPRDAADLAELQRAYRIFTLEESSARYREMIRNEPHRAGAYLELGKTLGGLNRQDESFEALVKAVELDPNLVDAHYYIGLIFVEQENWPAAKEAFQTALTLEPTHYRTCIGLGLVAKAEGNSQDAEQHFRAALKLDPPDPAVKRQLEGLLRSLPPRP